MTDALLLITLLVVAAGFVALVRLCDRIVGDTADSGVGAPGTGDSAAELGDDVTPMAEVAP